MDANAPASVNVLARFLELAGDWRKRAVRLREGGWEADAAMLDNRAEDIEKLVARIERDSELVI